MFEGVDWEMVVWDEEEDVVVAEMAEFELACSANLWARKSAISSGLQSFSAPS